MTNGNGTVIDVRDLNMVFSGRGTETVALKDASLQVEQGEFISLIGPSGSTTRWR